MLEDFHVMNSNGQTIQQHFENREPTVRATYLAILTAAKKLGSVKEEPRKRRFTS